VLNAFLGYAGLQPASVAGGLAPRVRAKLRVESPLVTREGNVVIGLTSMNDDVVRGFDLQVELPASARGPFAGVFVVSQGSRRLQPVGAKVTGSRLALSMPEFDTHASIVALKDFTPLVGLELKGVRRGVAGLARIDTNQAFEVEATVYNPSGRKLAAGEMSLAIPAGWLQSAGKQEIAAVRAGASERCTFRIRAPALAAATRIHPLVAHYRSGKTESTPATEMVWWGPNVPAE
jgi:hypothetical protein